MVQNNFDQTGNSAEPHHRDEKWPIVDIIEFSLSLAKSFINNEQNSESTLFVFTRYFLEYYLWNSVWIP
jgi:hypothetical protein